jgi:hypothetical protein
MVFQATHVVGGQGAPTWPAPDGTAPPGPRLDPWLAVQVIQPYGSWAHIRCENGWEAWTDARLLQASYPHPAAYPSPTYQQPAYQQQTPYGAPVGRTGGLFRVLSPVGALLAVGATWLPWLTFGSASVNGWDLELWAVLTDGDNTGSSLKIGLPMLVAGLAIMAAFLRPPAAVLVLCALFAAVPPLILIARWVGNDVGGLHLGIGPPAGILAGVLLLVAAIDAAAARR